MLHVVIAILGILLTIFFVVVTHESAHFFAAKLLGVKVLRYSIGFGKTLFKWHDKKGTEYIFALIPLGGYVGMLDENTGPVPLEERHLAYNRQPFYKKFLIVIAGPLSNFFFAFLLYWLIFSLGFTTIKPIIGKILPHSIAAESGLQVKQEIINLNGKKIMTWQDFLFQLLLKAEVNTSLSIDVKDLKKNSPTKQYVLNLKNWHLDELEPDPLKALGIVPYEPEIPLIIGMIKKNSPAAQSALKINDRIIAVNHVPVTDWIALIRLIEEHPDTYLNVSLERQGKIIRVPIFIAHQGTWLFKKKGYLGIGPKISFPREMLSTIQYPLSEAAFYAAREVKNLTYLNFFIFGKIITGKISLQSLGGPITIFEGAGMAMNYGLLPFFSFLAFLSIAVGVINILPIPGLDGGHIVIQLIELIRRKPLSERVLVLIYRLGFALLILLLIQASLNDIMRLF